MCLTHAALNFFNENLGIGTSFTWNFAFSIKIQNGISVAHRQRQSPSNVSSAPTPLPKAMLKSFGLCINTAT